LLRIGFATDEMQGLAGGAARDVTLTDGETLAPKNPTYGLPSNQLAPSHWGAGKVACDGMAHLTINRPADRHQPKPSCP
jgi:hypothetical protein